MIQNQQLMRSRKFRRYRGSFMLLFILPPKFNAVEIGTPQIYLPANPTVLQVKHELSHYLDYKRLGYDGYVQLSRHERERMVLERLQNNRIWEEFNESEKQFSIDYVERLNTNKSGLTNDKR